MDPLAPVVESVAEIDRLLSQLQERFRTNGGRPPNADQIRQTLTTLRRAQHAVKNLILSTP